MKELNVKEMILILKIYNSKFKREPNITELCKYLGISQDHSNFTKVRTYLEDKKVLHIEEDRGNKIVIIDKIRLGGEIPDLPFIKFYELNFRNKFKSGFSYK